MAIVFPFWRNAAMCIYLWSIRNQNLADETGAWSRRINDLLDLLAEVESMNRKIKRAALCPLTASLFCLLCISVLGRVQTGTAAPHTENRAIAEADCSAEKLGATIPVSAIGEQVSGVTLGAGQSVGATKAGNRNIIPITGETR